MSIPRKTKTRKNTFNYAFVRFFVNVKNSEFKRIFTNLLVQRYRDTGNMIQLKVLISLNFYSFNVGRI